MPKPAELEQPKKTERTEITEADVVIELQKAARKLDFGFTIPRNICDGMANGVMNGSGYSFRVPTADEKKVKAFVAEIEKNICGKIRSGLKEDEGEHIKVTMEKRNDGYKISIDRSRPRAVAGFEEE